MKLFILLNALLELGVGVLMILFSKQLPGIDASDIMTVTLARMYGAAAITIGFYALKVWKTMLSVPQIKSCLTILAVFHLGIAYVAFGGYWDGISLFAGVAILHLLLLLIAIGFIWNLKGKNGKLTAN